MCDVLHHHLGKGARCAPPLHPPGHGLDPGIEPASVRNVSTFHPSQRSLRRSPAPHRPGAFEPPGPLTMSWRPGGRSCSPSWTSHRAQRRRRGIPDLEIPRPWRISRIVGRGGLRLLPLQRAGEAPWRNAQLRREVRHRRGAGAQFPSRLPQGLVRELRRAAQPSAPALRGGQAFLRALRGKRPVSLPCLT